MLEHGLGAAAEPDVESAAELESAGEQRGGLLPSCFHRGARRRCRAPVPSANPRKIEMERTGIEPVTSGLQSRENKETAEDG